MMKLSKKIPSRTKTVEFKWAYKFFLQCDEKYLAIRGKHKRRGKITMTFCDWCKHEFEIGEWFALAQPMLNQEGPKRNWALCHGCADIIGAPDRNNNANNDKA